MMRSKTLCYLVVVALLLSPSSCVGKTSQGGDARRASPVVSSTSAAQPRPSATLPQNGDRIAEADARAVPPADGFYLVVNGKPVPLPEVRRKYKLPSELSGSSSIYYRAIDASPFSGPTAASRMPIVLYQASAPDSVSPADLVLFKLKIGLGIGFADSGNQCVVSSVQTGSGADKAGLEWKDIILVVDGQQCDGCSQVRQLLDGQPFTTVRITVLRGTTNVDLTATRETLIDLEKTPLDYVPKGNYVQLAPRQPLSAGVYGLAYESYKLTSELGGGYAFVVMPFQVK